MNAPEMTYIYGLVDPRTGLISYIGKTNNLEDRLKKHIGSCNSIQERTNRKSRWINSLILNNLLPTIVELDKVPYCDWEFWEKHYIQMFKSMGANLHNGTLGGEKKTIITEETRNKLSAAQKGKKYSPEKAAFHKNILLTKAIPNSANARRGKKRPTWISENLSKKHRGKIVTQETKDKQSKALKGRKIHPNTLVAVKIFGEKSKKPVIQFDKNGIFIKEWDCASNTGFNKSNILRCCKGFRKTAGGFIWKFKILTIKN